jgi:hypothetical protein
VGLDVSSARRNQRSAGPRSTGLLRSCSTPYRFFSCSVPVPVPSIEEREDLDALLAAGELKPQHVETTEAEAALDLNALTQSVEGRDN